MIEQDEHEAHLDSWAQESETFIRDGVVCHKRWRESERRVLFLMKEDYATKQDNDIREKILRKKKILRKTAGDKPDLGGGTLSVAAQWAFACQNFESPVSLKNTKKPDRDAALRECAWVNLKKTRGESLSSKEQLRAYLEKDGNDGKLRRQLELIDPAPQLIICGNTWKLAKEFVWPGKKYDPLFDLTIRIVGGPVVIDFCHPGARIRHDLMFHSLCSILRGIATEIG